MRMGITSFVKGRLIHFLNVFVALGLVSCTTDNLPELSIDTVSIYAEPDANQNSATAVDLVLVYNQELEKTLGQTSAAKYFSSSKQLLLDNPSLLDIWHWELVPGQIVQNFTPPQEQGDAFAGYVFANYITPGDHRVKVAPDGIVKIILLKNDLKNVATSNTHDMRVGTTMTNVPKGEGTDLDMDTGVNQMKLGPTENSAQSCTKVTNSCQERGDGTECIELCAPLGKPIPIVTRPLGSPPCGRRSTPSKVKVWRN